MESEELSRLEGIIEKLLQKFARLAKENERLEASLFQKEQDIRELRESISRLKEEKGFIHNRVSSLITSLEQWEAQAGTLPPEDKPDSTGDQPASPAVQAAPGLEAGA